MKEDKKDKIKKSKEENENKDDLNKVNEEFRFTPGSKLFLIIISIITIVVFALFLNNSIKRKEKKEELKEANQVESDNNISNQDEKGSASEDEKELGIDLNLDSTKEKLRLTLNYLFGESYEIPEEILYNPEDEQSYIYYNNEVYEWLPDYKVLSTGALEGNHYTPNYFGRLSVGMEATDITPDKMTEEYYDELKSNKNIAIYNPQISEHHIDHVGIIDDNFIMLVMNSKMDFDSHVYKKKDFKIDEDYKTNFKKNPIFFAENFIDRNLTQRLKGIEEVDKEEIEKRDVIWIDSYESLEKHSELLEIDSEKSGYVFIRTNINEDLYKLYYSFFIDNGLEDKDVLLMLDLISILKNLD